jgi:stearoyl-CoA desaturase (delta-9 desaturase)
MHATMMSGGSTTVTVGFHRMLTHRSFRTSKPVEYFFAAAGSMAVQGPVINWVADHRKHHAHTDEEGDPHSPHVGAGKGVNGAFRGLLHAHVGWLLTEHGRADRAKYARDLVEDRGMRIVDKGFVGWVLLGLALARRAGLAHHRLLHRRADRSALGRPRARLPAASRHVVDQLGLPFLRAPAL